MIAAKWRSLLWFGITVVLAIVYTVLALFGKDPSQASFVGGLITVSLVNAADAGRVAMVKAKQNGNGDHGKEETTSTGRDSG